MSTEKLVLLKEIYAEDKNLVLITNKNWDVVWSNQATKIKNMNEVFELSPDDWKTDRLAQPEEKKLYKFRHFRNDGIRLVSCEADPLRLIMPVVKVLSSAAHTQATVCHAVYRLLEELPEGDDLILIGALSGNCYRMHRLSYVLREIYEQESNITEDVCFSLTAQMEEIFNSLKSMYGGRYMFLECDFETKNLFVKMDRGAFVCAILAGISISMLEPDKFQVVEMLLEEMEEKKSALIQITVKPEMGDEQPDRRLQIKDLDAISNDKEFLDVFCKKYGCQWKSENKEVNAVFTLEVPLCEQEKSLAMHLNSLDEDKYFNAYTAMLSILHHRMIM